MRLPRVLEVRDVDEGPRLWVEPVLFDVGDDAHEGPPRTFGLRAVRSARGGRASRRPRDTGGPSFRSLPRPAPPPVVEGEQGPSSLDLYAKDDEEVARNRLQVSARDVRRGRRLSMSISKKTSSLGTLLAGGWRPPPRPRLREARERVEGAVKYLWTSRSSGKRSRESATRAVRTPRGSSRSNTRTCSSNPRIIQIALERSKKRERHLTPVRIPRSRASPAPSEPRPPPWSARRTSASRSARTREAQRSRPRPRSRYRGRRRSRRGGCPASPRPRSRSLAAWRFAPARPPRTREERPRAVPATFRARPSKNDCKKSRPRPAPRAVRTATPRLRAMRRTRTRLLALAEARRSARKPAIWSMPNMGSVYRYCSSRSLRRRKLLSRWDSGYRSASLRENRSSSEPWPLPETPGARRARTWSDGTPRSTRSAALRESGTNTSTARG